MRGPATDPKGTKPRYRAPDPHRTPGTGPVRLDVRRSGGRWRGSHPTVLDLYTEDCFAGRVRSGEGPRVRRVCEFPYQSGFQTGPFHIEGAEPGDTVAVHFVWIEPARDWAASTTVPSSARSPPRTPRPRCGATAAGRVWIWQLDGPGGPRCSRHGTATSGRKMPLTRCTARWAWRPPTWRCAARPWCRTRTAGTWTRPRCGPGVPALLGVNVEGALLSLGDGHARQGEGETCGVAVECAMNTVVVVTSSRASPPRGPRLESDTHIISSRIGPPAGGRGVPISQLDLVQWLVRRLRVQ